MKDIKILELDKYTDELEMSLGDEIQEVQDPNSILIQKIVYLLKQKENSNPYNPEGFSKTLPIDENEAKINISFRIKKMADAIIQEQENNYLSESPLYLLERIEIADISLDNNIWKVGLVVYDKSGGKTFLATGVS